MAHLAAARGVGHGPLNLLLSHSGAQWATILGMGAYIYNPDIFVQEKHMQHSVCQILLRLE